MSGQKIILYSCDGKEYQVDYHLIEYGSRLLNELVKMGNTENGIKLDIKSDILEIVIKYFEFKVKYSDAERGIDVPFFEINKDKVIDVLLAADYLQC